MKGSGMARFVIAAPAKAEDRLGKDSERTICGGFGISISIQFSWMKIKHAEALRRDHETL
jgi:hypothetical protein